MGSKAVALVVAVFGVIALAAAGIYLYRHHGAAPRVEDKVATGEKPAAETEKPAEGRTAESTPSKPTSVPSFDVVRIEPTGYGVIAGRAEPGWTIALESGGNKIAESKVDEEGAWSIVLDKPLSSGDHALTLRATSPDGTKALTGQQPVNVAVGKPAGEAVAQKEAAAPEPPTKEAAPTTPEESKPEQQIAEPQAVPGQPEPVVPDESAPAPERPKPPVKIGKVDYQDTGADSGKISLSGVGDPNARILLFYDAEQIGQAVVGDDGTWAIEIEKKLGSGEHTIRADTYDIKTGMVAGRASVGLGREEKPAEAAPGEAPGSKAAVPGQPEPVYPQGAPSEAAVAEAGQSSGQPQPVYPDGPPADLEASTPPPVTATAAAEPQGLSSRQPVYPEEQAQPEVAAAEPPAAVLAPTQPEAATAEPPAPQSEPAPAEPSQAVTAETPSEAKPPEEPKKAPVVFKSVDYQDTGADSGKVALSGSGEPGARIFLYIDETPLGEVSVGSDGTWAFEADRKLETGEHKFRADGIEEATRTFISSASIGIVRMEPPKPAEEQIAAPAPQPAAPAPEAATPPPEPEQEVAAAEEARPAPTVEKRAQRKRYRPRVYTVRRGDTLWEIAEAYFGGGWHYRAIVRDNRRKIRDPHWIYPKQKFHMPAGR
jgi:nucleoid-associated protein YgaU